VRYLKVSLVLVALAAAIVPAPAAVVERVYSRGLYAWLQPFVTAASSLLPLALLDVALGGLAAAGLIVLVRRWRAGGAVRALGRTLVSAVIAAAAVYLWFLVLWGLNYQRIPLEEKLAYDASRVTRAHAEQLAGEAVARVNALSPSSAAPVDEHALRTAFLGVARRLGAHGETRVARPKYSLVSWYLRYAAIDGFTNPLFLEIILHPDLLPFERPFVLAHEWAHLAGYADEAEANFVAWLTCVRGTPAAQYSGWLVALQHLAGRLPGDTRRAISAQLSPAVIADLAAASERIGRSSPTVRTAARGAYDAYLRAHRVDEGIASYGAVVRLMLGATLDGEWNPELLR
jgi:hypothetical protein